MTLLTIAQSVALDVGLEEPSVVASSTAREMQEMLSYINEAGEEIARRVAWGELTAEATITGDGTSAAQVVNANLSRIADGASVFTSGGAIIRPLTRAEWPTSVTEGTPRYYLREGSDIIFWPYLASAATATVRYQTKAWTSATSAAFTADTQTALFSEDILAKGSIVRWRRQKGMPYQDHEAEYEAALAQYADFDDRSRL